MMTADELRAFEADIACEFNAGSIRAPVHLSGGNEEELISYFAGNVGPHDWVCSNWRSHYHVLLRGVPPSEVRAAIMEGRSITLNFPRHRVLSSAIVGGVLPIAVGIALGIKRNCGAERVHAFLGDMTAQTGIFWECLNYAVGHDLPIHFIVEDNGKSVGTNTAAAWGKCGELILTGAEAYVTTYKYELPWPHAGAGRWIRF